jgi:hypothetical protein
MARSKVGKPTGETTKAGRPVYKTPEGENVSEKSVTFVRDGKYINAPSIWNGVRLNEDEVGKLYDAGAIKATSVHDTAKEAVAAAKERSKGLMAEKKKIKKYRTGGLGGSQDLDYEQQMVEMEGTPPEDTEESSFGKELTGFAADITPGVGEVRSAMDAKKAYEEGDMFGVGLGVVGAIPGIGMGARVAKRALKTVDEIKDIPKGLASKVKEGDDAYKLLGVSPEDAKKWKTEQPTNKQQQNPKLREAALKLKNKEITKQEYTDLVNEIMPIKMIEKMPEMPSLKRVTMALSDNKVKIGIVGLNKKIDDGTRVASRLDIPAYEGSDTWVVSLHDGTKMGGNAIGYGQTAVLKNVDFKTAPKGAINIATEKTAKDTIARIYGDWVNKDPDDVYDFAKDALTDPEWTQVGMNPYRHSFFYDKATGEPVVSAAEVVQVGPLVLAKDVKKTTMDDPMFRIDKNDPDSPTFAQGGTTMDPVKAAQQYQQQQGLMARTAMLPTEQGMQAMQSSSAEPMAATAGSVAPEQPTTMQTNMQPSKVKMPPGMAKGGMLAEGGVMQEGGTVDPESGNEVPPGALQEEVRDDIPAQLSEGEFIFPADVVRFIGLEKLMRLRQAAKKGLGQMEEMGQMGNASEATMDDDAEFETEIDDIISEVEAEADAGSMEEPMLRPPEVA